MVLSISSALYWDNGKSNGDYDSPKNWVVVNMGTWGFPQIRGTFLGVNHLVSSQRQLTGLLLFWVDLSKYFLEAQTFNLQPEGCGFKARHPLLIMNPTPLIQNVLPNIQRYCIYWGLYDSSCAGMVLTGGDNIEG